MTGRVVALDVGDKRIGVAVSDVTRTIAQPLETYARIGYGPDARHIKALCERYETGTVLLGLPLNMDGSEGAQAEKTRAFGEVLREAGLTVHYADERLSSVAAERALIEGNMRREDRKRHVDKVAAAVILEQWLPGRADKERTYGERRL
ncbi:MAG: Holliday junction resolvase RuvX [Clostridiales bacterium]|nr:Holliday junction resolvase RuvX [Clostridiales bacterium]